jgi:2-keto-4-pentenoate hydratase
MDIATAKAASDLLVRNWTEGTAIEALPPALRPHTRAEGYLVQAQIERLDDGPLFGWKIAATSAAGQRHIGIDGPIAGRLLSGKVYRDGETVPFGANRMRVAEAEFAFQMERDLPLRPTPHELPEVMAAVGELFLAIEVPDSRYLDFVTAGGPQLIADNACAHLFVLGPRAPSRWRELDLVAHRVGGEVKGRLQCEGSGANVLGDPRIALTWLANELSSIGVPLRAGQIVTTGTCVTPMEIRPGDTFLADFGALGGMSCRIGE